MHAETVSVDPASGRLLLPDKWGDIYEAHMSKNGSYTLNPRPIAQLGPGRVLGSKVDAQGNLVMCDVLKVRALSLRGPCSQCTAAGNAGY